MERFSGHLSLGPSKVPNPKVVGGGAWGVLPGSAVYHTSSDGTLFSSSLPVLPHDKLNMNGVGNGFESMDDASCSLNRSHQGVEDDDLLEPVGANPIGSMLLDDEEDFLAGLMGDLDLMELPRINDLEDYDIFGSGGGMELETDPQDNFLVSSQVSLSDGVLGTGMAHLGIPNGVGTVAGEHPYGEHPSRTLFVRNINSNIEDSDLKTLFEQYGDIRTLYTACKHRGFVMISYYDIRAARTAMRALQNKPLRQRKLDIHFSIPKDNPSDKDINQGTLVVFNLDSSVSNDDLMQIFGDYGEVKEIRETPHKRHHKFIEYYDVRAAEAALRALNRSDIAGKRVKLEPSRPGGARRNLILQLNHDPEHDETQSFRVQVGSPLANSPPGKWGQFNSSSIEHGPMHTYSMSTSLGAASPNTSNHLPGLASILHHQVSKPVKIAPIGKDQGRSSSNSNHSAIQLSHSLPDSKLSNYPETILSCFGASNSNGSSIETLSGPQFLWGSPKPQSEHTKASVWPRPSLGNPLTSNRQGNGILHSSQQGPMISSNLNHHNHYFHHHHIGSAPSGPPLERHFGFFQESPETSFINSGFRGMGLGHTDRNFMMNMANHTAMNVGVTLPGNMPESFSPNFRMMISPRLGPMFLGHGPYPGLVPTNMDSFADRGRMRRIESNGNQMDSKKLFQLDLDKIISGEDKRTTLMIKNIPNKYTSKMLLAAIDEYNRGTYDFIYLPIDFKNKCNVGYAFINMLSAQLIIQFYKAFNGKKWEKFNSEKVASLAYARIQGKSALITHFQNSSLMNEDKRCRPILFHSDDLEAGTQIIQEHLPYNSLNIPVPQPNGFQFGDFLGSLTEVGSCKKPDES